MERAATKRRSVRIVSRTLKLFLSIRESSVTPRSSSSGCPVCRYESSLSTSYRCRPVRPYPALRRSDSSSSADEHWAVDDGSSFWQRRRSFKTYKDWSMIEIVNLLAGTVNNSKRQKTLRNRKTKDRKWTTKCFAPDQLLNRLTDLHRQFDLNYLRARERCISRAFKFEERLAEQFAWKMIKDANLKDKQIIKFI